MLTLYAIPESLYSAKLRIVLRHKGLKWRELPPPGGYSSEEYKRTVPSGNIPALIDGDLILADSEAIAEYLEEAHPVPAMLPAGIPARAKARERSRFHDTRLEPEVRALFGHVDPAKRKPDTVDRQAAAINARLAQLAVMLREPREAMLALCDCGFPVSFAWIEAFEPVLPMTIVWPKEIAAYGESLMRHDAVAEEMTAYRPAIESWIASKQS